MIKKLREQEARAIRERLPDPIDRIECFPEPSDYWSWIVRIADFLGSKGGSLAFGIENFTGEFEYFSADDKEEAAIVFVTRFAPLELVFFGVDWTIGISSYPKHEGSDTLEYSIRLYGAARGMGRV